MLEVCTEALQFVQTIVIYNYSNKNNYYYQQLIVFIMLLLFILCFLFVCNRYCVVMQPAALVVYIWLYCLFWFLVQDASKVLSYWLIRKYNVFNYNDTGRLELPESTLRYIEANKAKDLAEGAKPGGHGH